MAVLMTAQTPDSRTTLQAVAAPAGATEYTQEVIGWPGWGNLAGSFSAPVAVNDGKPLPELPPVVSPLKFRIRIFLYAHLDAQSVAEDGTVRFHRFDMEDPQVKVARAAIARWKHRVDAQAAGSFELVPEISVQTEPWRFSLGRNLAPDGATLDAEFGPRFNGGFYDDEQKVYRGPYHAVFFVSPAPWTRPTPLAMNATPFFMVPTSGTAPLEKRLWQALTESISARVTRNGAGTWPELLSFADPDPDRRSLIEAPTRGQFERDGTVPGVSSDNYTVSVVDDPQKGSVLNVSERALTRYGGTAISIPVGGIDPAKTPALRFEYATSSREPMALWFQGKSGTSAVSLGRDRVAAGAEPVFQIPVKTDGTWQTLTIDLAKQNLGAIERIWLAPPPGAVLRGKYYAGPIEAKFAAFNLLASAAESTAECPPRVADIASIDLDERVMAATAANDVALFRDADKEVALNVIRREAGLDKADRLAATVTAMNSIDPNVAVAAVERVATVETDAATAELRRVLMFGLTSASRGAAALALAKRPTPTMAGDLNVLSANREAATRLTAARALSMLPDRAAGIIRMSLLQQTDPRVKLFVTETADPKEEVQMARLPWSLVNETSDRVRLASAIKLIQSPVAKFQTEGYNAMKDDSVWVRERFAAYLADNPTETHRASLRIGVVDSSVLVRLQAVRGLASLLEPLTVPEIQPAFTDKYPEVLVAVITAVKARNLVVPEAVRKEWRESKYAAVRDAEKTLN